jgi:hypothetical protein
VILPGRVKCSLNVRQWGLGTAEGVAFDGERVWVYFVESGTLVALDPDTRKIVKRVELEKPFPKTSAWVTGLAWDGTSLWARAGRHGVMRAVDPETGAWVRDIKVSPSSRYFDIQGTVLFLLLRSGDTAELSRVDMTTGETLGTMPMKMERSLGVSTCACGGGFVFLGGQRSSALLVMSADDGRLVYATDIHQGSFFTGDMAYDPQRGLWGLSSRWGSLVLIEVE